MGDDCACGGIVVGEFARARERDACAVLLGDGAISGSSVETMICEKQPEVLGGGDAVGNHGFAVERLMFLRGMRLLPRGRG